MQPVPHLGEILSILAALIWAFSVVLFRLSGRGFRPVALNFFKNMVAGVLLLATMFVLREPILRRAPLLDYALLLASGVIGITLADTLFLRGLNLVGAGLSQIVNSAYSPFVIVFTFIFLGERLTAWDFAGASLILAGIIISSRHKPPEGTTRHDLRQGIGLSIVSVALMALGVTLAKPVLDRSPILWSTTIRLIGGAAGLIALSLMAPRYRSVWSTLRPSATWRVALPGAILGTYVTMIIWISGMKFTQASTASILNQTSAIFVLPFAAIILKEKVTPRKLVAVCFAVAGVVLVTLM